MQIYMIESTKSQQERTCLKSVFDPREVLESGATHERVKDRILNYVAVATLLILPGMPEQLQMDHWIFNEK